MLYMRMRFAQKLNEEKQKRPEIPAFFHVWEYISDRDLLPLEAQ